MTKGSMGLVFALIMSALMGLGLVVGVFSLAFQHDARAKKAFEKRAEYLQKMGWGR